MKRIFLLGYMGAGKSSLGKELARVLNIDFIDLDLFIQNRYHKTISTLFNEYGEDGFRKIEHNLLKEVAGFENVIISTGGGTPCFFDNMDYMNHLGTTIYLKAAPDMLAKRLISGKDVRPLLRDKTDLELLEFIDTSLKIREPYYLQSQLVFETENYTEQYDLKKSVSKMIRLLKLNTINL